MMSIADHNPVENLFYFVTIGLVPHFPPASSGMIFGLADFDHFVVHIDVRP